MALNSIKYLAVMIFLRIYIAFANTNCTFSACTSFTGSSVLYTYHTLCVVVGFTWLLSEWRYLIIKLNALTYDRYIQTNKVQDFTHKNVRKNCWILCLKLPWGMYSSELKHVVMVIYVTWSRGMSHMSLILILSYRLKQMTYSYVLHCF